MSLRKQLLILGLCPCLAEAEAQAGSQAENVAINGLCLCTRSADGTQL